MKHLLIIVAACIALASCSKKNDLVYFVDKEDVAEGYVKAEAPTVKILPGDELAILFTSEIPEASGIYNIPSTAVLTNKDLTLSPQPKVQTYFVDSDGNIDMPIIGEVHAEGLTPRQLAETLEKRIDKDVDKPFVKVNIVNFRVNVLGEVQQPGQVQIDGENATVLDALALAGDISIFGRRDNVTIIRQEKDRLVYHKLDLTKKESMADPYFYLQQGDAVLVEPGSARSGQAEFNQNNSFKLSVVSTIVSGISVIASLVIALVINK